MKADLGPAVDAARRIITATALPHDVLLENVRLATRLRAHTDDALAVGASRLGGAPDLPVCDWPRWDGYLEELVLGTGKKYSRRLESTSLSFLAQLGLSEIPDASGLLPESGWLYFFYDANAQPWGFDPRDRGAARVIYVDSDAPLSRRRSPADAEQFDAARVTADLVATLPRWPKQLGLDLDDRMSDAYWELADSELSGSEPHHRVLGWPKVIQGEMEMQCQLASHGIFCGDAASLTAAASERVHVLGARDWIMLLQLDSDEDGPGWMWGDAGCLYFWIRKQDLAARRFDRCWTILQCY